MSAFIRAITYLIIYLFPVLTNLVKHAGSTIIAIFVLFGIVYWLNRKTKPGFDVSERQVLWAFTAYFMVCAVFYIGHSLFTDGLSLAATIKQWRPGHNIRLLAFVPIYYLFYRISLKRWVLWHGTATAAIVCGIYAIVYIYVLSAGSRVTNSYEPVEFGEISITLGFISLTGIRYFYSKNKLLTIIPLLALFSGILACFLSGTRMAVLMIPILTVIFLFQLNSFRHPWLYRSIILLLTVLISLVGYYLPKSSLKHRVQQGIVDAGTFLKNGEAGPYSVQLSLWKEGWEIYKAHPLLGSGERGYRNAIDKKFAAGKIFRNVAEFSTPHNIYLIKMIAYGIPGLLVLLAIFAFPFFLFIKILKANEEAKDIAYSGIMLTISFMFFGMTEHIFKRNITTCFYTIMLSMIISLSKQFEDETMHREMK